MAYQGQTSRSPFGHPQVHLNNSGVEEYNGGETIDLKLPIDFSLADATVLYTVPANITVRVMIAYWEITTSWTGGSSSAIGLSSSATGYTTKGMVHGGSAGDVAAALVSTTPYNLGTVGTGLSATPKLIILPTGSTIRFDKVTSAFTAGAGFVHLDLRVVG